MADNHVVHNGCVVFIEDTNNNKLTIDVFYEPWKPIDEHNSNWQWKVSVSDRGTKLSIESGNCYYDADRNDMFLVNSNNVWGVKFSNFKMANGNYVNMQGGVGTVVQRWVKEFEPGHINWSAPYGWVKL